MITGLCCVDASRGIVAACGGTSGVVRLYDTRHATCLHTLRGHKGAVNAMYHWPRLEIPGSTRGALITVGADATIRTWDPDTGRCRATLSDHSHAVTCMVLVDHLEGLAVSASEAFHDKLSKANLRTVPHADYHADIVQEFSRNKEVLSISRSLFLYFCLPSTNTPL